MPVLIDEYEPPDITKTPEYKRAMDIVLKVAKKHQGQAVTYGYLSRQVPPESKQVFEDVLRDAASRGVLSWRQDQPAPSAVRF